ncbi:GntR family transcriptional regulator [Sphingomonas soli]|uniref:GntR family transcriptional regulator n=1 Tax=Sphingomonas soli TaxID=266127 RepID=UPI0009FC5F74|nr:GntR family transcriptional regulator [Sphingomonas soli]
MALTPSTIRKPGDAVSARDIGEWLRDRIRRGRFVPGQRLIEADIIRETGASRSRVREAIQRLESEGLLVIEEFRGASVKRFSIEELRQIYRARMALEGMAAHDFALLGGQDQKQALMAIQEQLNTCENTADHERFAALNDEWHRLIIEGGRNDYIGTFVQRLRVPLYRLLFATFYSSERLDLANAGHRKITIAIVNGDAQEAERLMREHIEEGLGALSGIDIEFHS